MKALNKKEIRSSVKEALTKVVGSFELEKPSKKTEKLIEKTSRKISREIREEMKKQAKKMIKAGKPLLSKKIKNNSVAA